MLETLMDDAAWRVVDILARWDAKFADTYGIQRKYLRRPCRIVLEAAFADADWDVQIDRQRIWMRDVSEAGMAFLCNELIELPHVIFEMPHATRRTRFRGELVRRREVHNRFFDHGVRFVGRAAYPQSGRDSAGDLRTPVPVTLDPETVAAFCEDFWE
ncbi:MAG: hypothetical protein AAF532_08820 [Planctomycetota bacterium]